MASGIYRPMLLVLASGGIDFSSDDFKVVLVTSDYAPNFSTHDFRNDLTDEVVGAGYTAGGEDVVVTLSADYANSRVSVSVAAVTWESATITARAAVIYRDNGGAASADDLIAYADFGENKSSSDGDFVVTFTTPIYITASA